MLSCYDAQLSYDSRTDTFRARYWKRFPSFTPYNIQNFQITINRGEHILAFSTLILTFIMYCRYSPHGRRMVEENISWDRLRAPPVDTPSHVLHNSDCLHDLKPGDHIEIQWRRNKEFPYGAFLSCILLSIHCGLNSIGFFPIHSVFFSNMTNPER